MKCEVHSSDLDVFVNSLKRVADDVRCMPEEKGKCLIIDSPQCFYHVSTGPINHCMRYQPIRRMAGALISLFALDHSALVSPTDKRPRQMQHVDHEI